MVVDIFPAPTNDTVVPIPTPLVRPTPIDVVASKKRLSLMVEQKHIDNIVRD